MIPDRNLTAAYGGLGWSPRTARLRDELGSVWAPCGSQSETALLRSVLLHRPGSELDASSQPDAVQMLAPVHVAQATAQHDELANTYRRAGVGVHYVDPPAPSRPNQMFVADLVFMTPEGAILARPASTVRAGEERAVARRLTELGIPIVMMPGGNAVFEGADAAWIDAQTVMVGVGLRTNAAAVDQIRSVLGRMGVSVVSVDLPPGAMHLMGLLRFLDSDLAIAWPGRLPADALAVLDNRGYTVRFVPELSEAVEGQALNFVTLGPRKVLMPAGNPVTQTFLEANDVECLTVPIDELAKAAGGIGCLTGVLQRE